MAVLAISIHAITPRFAIGINALLLFFCLLIPLQGLGPRGSALWLTIAAILLGNAIFHVRAPYPEDPRRRQRADADLRREST